MNYFNINNVSCGFRYCYNISNTILLHVTSSMHPDPTFMPSSFLNHLFIQILNSYSDLQDSLLQPTREEYGGGVGVECSGCEDCRLDGKGYGNGLRDGSSQSMYHNPPSLAQYMYTSLLLSLWTHFQELNHLTRWKKDKTHNNFTNSDNLTYCTAKQIK